jgi:putative heme iron utilization protein
MIKYEHDFSQPPSMTETITPAVSDRICKHMNEDHRDAIALYAKYYGQISSLENAKMLSIDNEGMYLVIDEEKEKPLRIEFDHTLEDAKDAHHTLVEMLRKTR